MTQLLNLLTHDFVLQACDRRLTYPNGTIADPDANKAAWWELGTAFVYSGWATMPPDERPTDYWLGDVLAPLDMDGDALVHLAERAAEVVGSEERQAFLGISWARGDSDDDLRPMAVMVSNAYGDEGWLEEPRSDFTVLIRLLRPSMPFQLGACPPLLEDEHRLAAVQFEYLQEQGAGPAEFGNVLVETVRRVAARNCAVGEAVLLNCYPRNAHGSGSITTAGPNLETRSFSHVPADSTQAIHLAPTFISKNIRIEGLHLDVPPGTRLVQFGDDPT